MTGPDHRPSCRSCGHDDIALILRLGQVPLANALLSAEQLGQPEECFPLDLFFCQQCALVQIGETVAPEKLFANYAYASSYSDTMLTHSRSLVQQLAAERRLSSDHLVTEIASNDGYLLQYYKELGIPVLGIEPAANIAEVAIGKGIPTLIEFFDETLAGRLAAKGCMADIVHAHNVFAHVPDPNRFVLGLKRVLKSSGIALIEAPYIRDLIEKLEFDTIYHEHFSYYSLSSVESLCRRHALMVADVERIQIHGGSLRFTISHAGAQPSERVTAMLAEERAAGLLDFDYYRNFADHVWRLRDDLVNNLIRLKADGARIAAYGASAKGSTLMNSFKINGEFIDFVVDRSPIKQGRFTPGNHLAILPPSALVERRPDYVLLLTWNFADEILQQQKAYRDLGGRFIVPVPAVRIV